MELAVVGGDRALESGAGFVIHDVERGGLVGCGETRVDVRVGGDTVCILFGCKWSNEDGVAVGMERDHDVLVATASPRLKSAGVVREEAVDGKLVEFDTVGFG